MRRRSVCLRLAGKTAETATTLLITGESGTGKDQLARLIHEHGPRRDAPLLKIDCASLPSELVESELFGHERGAFTGAVARKPGRFEMAQGGTIVLDEVAALAPAMQAKLLRVLEERHFERLGGTDLLRINARLMALTNTRSSKSRRRRTISRGPFFPSQRFQFRFCRFGERPADIVAPRAHFLERLGPVHGRLRAKLDPSAVQTARSLRLAGKRARIEKCDRARAVVSPEDSLPSSRRFS